MTNIKNNTMTAAFENETASSDLGDSRLAFMTIMAMSALVGVWGTSCIISGIMSAATVSDLGRGLITAVSGI